MPTLSPEDLRELEDAVRRLESTTLAMRIADRIGKPIEYGLKRLPAASREMIHRAARTAMEKCLDIAVRSLGNPSLPSSDRFHKAAAGITGAVGGFFGLAALTVELPVSTAIMLRAIAEIARQKNEDIEDLNTRLACLEVFALGGSSAEDDAAETGYFAIRAGLAQALREAAAYIGERGFAEAGAPAIVRLAAQIATRFGITLSEKAVAQSVPVIGSVAGGAINLVFTDHFQQIAHGHFAVRRLERKYGAEPVRAEYDRIKSDLDAVAG